MFGPIGHDRNERKRDSSGVFAGNGKPGDNDLYCANAGQPSTSRWLRQPAQAASNQGTLRRREWSHQPCGTGSGPDISFWLPQAAAGIHSLMSFVVKPD